ncbi:hypothetical protein CV770_26385 [Bradyrhizobium sp. AC87j1]|nr:hypothetical protein CV770_26385 [Bradyrhizobium sp. AC87j1]
MVHSRASAEQLGVFFVEPDELDQVFDVKVGERLNTIFADAIDPNQAVLYTAICDMPIQDSPRDIAIGDLPGIWQTE